MLPPTTLLRPKAPPSPDVYFASFGWTATRHPVDGMPDTWRLDDAAGDRMGFCLKAPVSEETLWLHWRHLAEDLLASEHAARYFIDLLDGGAFGDAFPGPTTSMHSMIQ